MRSNAEKPPDAADRRPLDPAKARSSLGRSRVALPLLAFGAGAADAFAFSMLGGIFTANMTGNAVLAAMFEQPTYGTVLIDTFSATTGFTIALFIGFRLTRSRHGNPVHAALTAAAGCHVMVALLWWFGPHTRGFVCLLLSGSAAGMALQTVAVKRGGVEHGPPTTYVTGVLTDLVHDIVDGNAGWTNSRWLPLAALPCGAIAAVLVTTAAPSLTPLIPTLTTFACIALISRHVEPGRTPLGPQSQ